MAKEKNKAVSEATEKNTEKKTAKKAIKSIPAMPFEDVLHLSQAIWECASGKKVRKITLFDHLGKSPDKEEITLTAGNALFYHPAEAQHYKYFKKDKTHVCWIHFGGSRIPDLLNKLGLDNVRTLRINNGSIIEEKIHSIVDEMDLQKDFYEEEINSKLVSLLIAVARNEKQQHQNQNEELINMICEKIRQNYTTDFTIAEYAAECDMSISYFLRIFKRVTGTSPHNYQIKQRLMAAKGMLINTDYSILEISKLVGFEDSMYFSRCFKKYEGISPKAYKNKMKNVL